MKIKVYVLDLEIPRRTKGRIYFAAGLAALLGASAVAYAGITPFNAGETLSATAMNANFIQVENDIAAVQSQVSALQSFQGRVEHNQTYSLGATFCGATPLTYSGIVLAGAAIGYPAAKSLCEATCGNSPTAHMCTGEELVRYNTSGGGFLSLGTSGQLWYASASFNQFQAGSQYDGEDCYGFTSDVTIHGGLAGTVWAWTSETPQGYPAANGCAPASPAALACCD